MSFRAKIQERARLAVGPPGRAERPAVANQLDVELEDARWFARDEVLAMFEGRHAQGLTPPAPMAIAHHILRVWAEGG